MLQRRRAVFLTVTGAMIIFVAVVLVFAGMKSKGGNKVDQQKEINSIEASPPATSTTSTSAPVSKEAVVQPAHSVEAGEQGVRVKVDQVGYETKHSKIAIVEGELPAEYSFALVDEASGEQVFTGSLSEPFMDEASQELIRRADFSSFQRSGLFRITVDGVGSSYPFEIGANPYQEPLAILLRSYTLQRTGVDIDDSVTGLKQKAGHLQDAKAEVFFDDGVSHKGEVVDVSGGWYDAGDYGKYIPPAAVTVAQLLLAYELNPEAFPIGQLEFPDGLQALDQQPAMPDILVELKYELDWMLRMQRSDGALYHKVSGAEWTGFSAPDTDTQTRYVFGLSSYGTAQFVGATALAARIYQPFDNVYSKKLLTAAVKAQHFLTANEAAFFRNDAGQDNGSGAYGKKSDAEERLWALAELFRTTGEIQYSDTLTKRYDFLLKRSPQAVNWGNALLLGQWAYYNGDKTSAEWKGIIRKVIAERAEELLIRVVSDGYLNTLKSDEYTWASVKTGAAYGCMLMLANLMEPNEAYKTAALEQLHHVFGRSATGFSYVTGIGSRFPLEPHHRIQASSGVAIPGLVVGGPNRYGGDPDLDAVKAGLAPAKAYLDVRASYSSNEYAIDYNAPVIMLTSFFVN